MIMENSSLLGYVFIIAGVAMGIMAYGIYLTLRKDISQLKLEEVDKNAELVMEDSPIESEPSPPETPIMETPFSSDVIIGPAPMEEVQVGPQIESAEIKMTGVDMDQQQELISVVNILREVDSGNLVLRIGEVDYTSVEELQASPHLSRIMRLSADLDQWMQPVLKPTARAKRTYLKPNASETETFSPRSMVEEINEILERRLKEEPVKRKAIKLVEMLDGGVNVYIGVDSYPIDEVPFEDVQQLIRQAVSEWEQRQ